MCVKVLFSVDVGSGAGKFQQLLVLVDDQRRVQLAQCQQVCAENSTAHIQSSGTMHRIHFTHKKTSYEELPFSVLVHIHLGIWSAYQTHKL